LGDEQALNVQGLGSELLELGNSLVEQVRDACQVDSGTEQVGLEALFAIALCAEDCLGALEVGADAGDRPPSLARPLGLPHLESLQLCLQLLVCDLLLHLYLLIIQY
jgi:hypothetical protein